jgi:hypothetical protein
MLGHDMEKQKTAFCGREKKTKTKKREKRKTFDN